MLKPNELFEQIKNEPKYDIKLKDDLLTDARTEIQNLYDFFVPMNYMYLICETIFRAMFSSYSTMSSLESTLRINKLIYKENSIFDKMKCASSAKSASILGTPGLGKTETIKRCLRTMPSVIEHTSYKGEVFYCKQITHIFVECPADCSIKMLMMNMIFAIDKLVGTEYSLQVKNLRNNTELFMLLIKKTFINYNIGIVIIDEVQNLVKTSENNKRKQQLIKFLVELMNDTTTSIILVGTLETKQFFLKEEHLKRRSRGLRLAPMMFDDVYLNFLNKIWKYQYTSKQNKLTEKLAKEIYKISGGVPSYIIDLFVLSQLHAINTGKNCISEQVIKDAAKLNAIQGNETHNWGINTSISNFVLNAGCDSKEHISEEVINVVDKKPISKRGRKRKPRSNKDILVLVEDPNIRKDRVKVIEILNDIGLIEEWKG